MTMTVLVPGAGGAAAVSTIKALRIGDFEGRIVSSDAEPLSAGFYLSDGFRVVPKASQPGFFPAVKRLIEEEKITVILPTSGFDIYEYAKRKPELTAMGVVVAMSDPDAMSTCANKWEFYLKTHGAFPLPETSREPLAWTRFPCFVKPTFGKGSRNAYRCETRDELEFHVAHHKDLLVQDYLPGEEYTVDVLSDLAGTPLLAVPRVRLETKEGISSKGRVQRDPEIERLCLEMARHIGLKGPTCMQLKRDVDGRLKFLEVNPRIAGGSMFTTLAGVNIPKLLVDMIAGMELALPTAKDIVVLRYYEEVVLDARAR
jgi:carbamoyl-phosphate synthase large subunit